MSWSELYCEACGWTGDVKDLPIDCGAIEPICPACHEDTLAGLGLCLDEEASIVQ